MVYVLYSMAVPAKPLLATDVHVITVSSAMLHIFKATYDDFRSQAAIVSALSSTFTVVMCGILFVRQIERNSVALYTATTNLNNCQRVVTDVPETYTTTWYDFSRGMLVEVIMAEILLSFITAMVWFTPASPATNAPAKAPQRHCRTRSYKDCQRLIFYELKEDKEEDAVSVRHMDRCLGQTVSFFMMWGFGFLFDRYVSFTLGVVYDIPYWTVNDSVSAIFYVFLWGLFIFYVNPQYRTATTRCLLVVLIFVALIVSSVAVIRDSQMVTSTGSNFCIYADYFTKMTGNQDLGGYYYTGYTTPLLPTDGVVTTFSGTTYNAHMTELLLLLVEYALFGLCTAWFLLPSCGPSQAT